MPGWSFRLAPVLEVFVQILRSILAPWLDAELLDQTGLKIGETHQHLVIDRLALGDGSLHLLDFEGDAGRLADRRLLLRVQPIAPAEVISKADTQVTEAPAWTLAIVHAFKQPRVVGDCRSIALGSAYGLMGNGAHVP
jgi:hypothetical protein